MAVPLAMVIGYGVARTGATAAQELRNTVFATVAQRAIREVSGNVFAHLQGWSTSRVSVLSWHPTPVTNTFIYYSGVNIFEILFNF